jgi:hypothetical protein
MIAVTHREDMDPYFSERLRIHTNMIPSEVDGLVSVSGITYPMNVLCNLDNINLHMANSSPPKYCELCKCEVAFSMWQKHIQSLKHVKLINPVDTPVSTTTVECIYCKCMVDTVKLEKHNQTKIHITKKQNYDAIRNMTDTDAILGTNFKLICRKCANGCEYSVKQWEKHVLTKKHISL